MLPLHRWPGVADRPAPLVALHGFTGSGEDFEALAPLLGREILAPDLPGHGEAATLPGPYTMERVTAALAGLLGRNELERPVLLGYSMGGRVALSFALRYPDRVAALVLIGANPGLVEPAERAARRRSDEALAARIEAEGVPAFLAYWSAVPLIATQARIPEPYRSAARSRRLRNRARGLAASLRELGTGAMPPLWRELPRLAAPTLLITGAEDAKYRAIAARMAGLIPGAQRALIPGAGHCAHLEQPELSCAAIDRFLSRAVPALGYRGVAR